MTLRVTISIRVVKQKFREILYVLQLLPNVYYELTQAELDRELEPAIKL